jgi:hypothetical protein
MKARTRRKLLWTVVALALCAIVAAIAVPPFINLDGMRPTIEAAVKNQTGIDIKINGPVRLSLLGRATIGARDVQIPSYQGVAESVSFRIPLHSIFNINTAAISSTAVLNNARLTVTSLAPPQIPGRIVFKGGQITFGDRTFTNINGVFRNNTFSGSVRTAEHRYAIETDGNFFIITNPNVRLRLRGQLVTDDSGNIAANGNLGLETSQINRFFEFDAPRITSRVKFKSDFEWKSNRLRFYNIVGETKGGDFTGEIQVENGHKTINLVADNIDLDLSFLQKNPAFLHNSDIRFAGNGRFRIAGHEFSKIRFASIADNNVVTVRNLTASGRDISMSARGRVGNAGADNLEIVFQNATGSVHCILSGNRDSWSCGRWNYKSAEFSASGSLVVGTDSFDLEFNSENYDPTKSPIGSQFSTLGQLLGRNRGTIRFRLGDGLHGAAELENKNLSISYFSHRNTTIAALPINMQGALPLPESMMNAPGEMRQAHIINGGLSFAFATDEWELLVGHDGNFGWTGNLLTLVRAYRPGVDVQFLNPNSPIVVRGKFNAPFISDFEIVTVGGTFSGTFNGRAFDLHGEFLDLDSLINQNYVNDYESMKFISAEPLTFPFMMNMSVALTADMIRFGGEVYERFVYSLTPTRQRMSVTDSARGSMLVSMDRTAAHRYNLLIQSNNFEISGALLPLTSSLNVADTSVTARATLETHGFTANDFWRNMMGDIEMSFEGGTLIGFDFDNFYDSAQQITRLNAEFALADALAGGQSALRSLHISGHYENGIFTTTSPLSAATRHTEYTGELQILRGRAAGNLRILLRGTSPAPAPMLINVPHGGARNFSLSEIMQTFDSDFMREFTRIHPRF